MVWDRMENKEIKVIRGYLHIANYQDFGLERPHAFVFQP